MCFIFSRSYTLLFYKTSTLNKKFAFEIFSVFVMWIYFWQSFFI